MKLKRLDVGPPGGWMYKQPETNHTMKGVTFEALVKKVAIHRGNNKLPMGDNLPVEIEAAICERLSVTDRVRNCDVGNRIPKTVGWRQIESFLKTAGTFLAGGGQCVDQSEAERRAAICAKCPLQASIVGCGVCAKTVDAFRKTILQRSTSQDSKLRNCGVCGCDNKAQVHIPIETLRVGTGHLDYSPNPECWKLRGGVNESQV